MLNLFITIIVNATDEDHEATQVSIDAAREHIEADLN